MRQKGYKCSNVECDRCVGHSMCGELGDAAMNCVDRIITRHTNADHIRAMDDEELAAFICCTGWRLSERKECLEWLQPEADEINI